MEPLDLRRRPPRSMREAVDGVLFLGRSIDKARATLPGGNPGVYFLTHDGLRTMSGLFFRRLGCAEADFVAAVAAAPNDAAVATWLRERVDQSAIDGWNALLVSIRMQDLDERTSAQFRRLYPEAAWSDEDLIVDVVDADDRRMFERAADKP